MQNEDYLQQIDVEVGNLQNKLKCRLQQAQDLGDLNKKVLEHSFKLEESTFGLRKTAEETKWKWLIEYAKWLILIGVVVFLLLLYALNSMDLGKSSQATEDSSIKHKYIEQAHSEQFDAVDSINLKDS